ncbi:MAG: C4-dicarboxylate ABC transporter [Rhodospirillales bacterium CG15_BIG_FIL_POST_REV_8_21_14_020_66_15]|nr:MAG: C4-dicarboxylate ABC transporter [Rhodospirillales bacterium CG15_BIG_FIL_POST_REV_8_21_14_020_66_15]
MRDKLFGENVFQSPISRRRFWQLTRTYGFTALAVTAAGLPMFSEEALAQTAKEEKERQKSAKSTMNLATEYVVGATRYYPLVQLNLKENIQNLTNGEVYVKLSPGGVLGKGGALASKVQSNTIQAAQHSVSNFAPFAPAIDLINVPYWANTNQKFVNLVTSKAWRDAVHTRVNERGFEVLLYLVLDPRTAATRKGFGKVLKTPEDMKGMKFRVPGSKILQQFYRMAGANPTPVAWGETPTAIKEGVADGLDPALVALYAAGFSGLLETVSFIKSVEDAQVYSCNLQWLRGLSDTAQEGIRRAAEITFQQNLAQVPASRAFAMAEMARSGTAYYAPNEGELAQWKEKTGAQRPEWDDLKKSLAGSLAKFGEFEEAANVQGRYYVDDVKG